MTDEVRNISVVVQATAAERSLIRLANNLDQLDGATGKTDAQLKRVDRTIDKAAAGMLSAARSVANLKGELRQMGKELTASGKESDRLASRLLTANKRLAEQKEIIKTQKSVITSLVRQNIDLANSLDKVATSAARAAAATNGIKPVKLKVNSDVMASQARTTLGLGEPLSLGKVGGELDDANEKLQKTHALTNALRYQLYDVGATFGIIGAAVTAAGVLFFKTAIDWDKNFANVIRTSQVTGNAVEWLKNQFLDLQSAVPVTSSDLATIGTLGAQMGVYAGNLANFTEITAKFSATSGTSVDEAATALSRLDQLLPDVQGNYERLASTILKTGVNAVATEQQIIRGTGQIAAIGRIAGLTTPEIVGLASALSSLGFSPELQRSVITSSFSKILTATSTVTAQTEKFGAVLNLTGKQFQSAWRDDAIGTYRDLLQTIASRGDAVSVLQDLGLASQRLTPNLLKLGQNTDVLNDALKDTRSEWSTNTELSRQYGIIADTVAARIQVLGQSWEALLVTLDSSDTIIKPLLDGLNGFLGFLRKIAQNPAISSIATLGTAIITLAGITALGAAGLALMSAGYVGITLAQEGLALAVAEHAALTAADTGAVGVNTAAKGGNTAANVANTVAVNANTAAQGGNAVATGAAGAGMLKFTSGVIGAVPKVLAWTGVIAAAAAAMVGLYTVLATADTWTVDLDKMIKGVDGNDISQVVDYNITELNKVRDKLAEMRADQEKYDQFIAKGGNEWTPVQPGGPNGYDYGQESWDVVEGQQKRYLDDIEDSILGLTSREDKLAAVNEVSKRMGVTQQELLTNILPDLGSALGDGAAAAAEMQDATVALESAQALWAGTLLTTDENLAKLNTSIQSGASKFLDFGEALTNAYDTSGAEGTGGGLDAFLSGMNNQISSFETFYANLGTLVQKGGVQLASLFAEQGPAASQALTDSLNLSPDQIAQIENQMGLAAFYASEEFANTFSQNNAILASVWQQTNSPEAVAAFNAALADSMKGGSIDPQILAQLADQFGVKIDVGLIPDFDKEEWDAQVALINAKVTPVQVPIEVAVGGMDYATVTESVDAWIVTMEGHTITLPVDPNTEQGRQYLADWRESEYQIPVSLQTFVDTNGANAQLQALHDWWNNQSIVFKVATSYAYNSGSVGGIPGSATGSLIGKTGLIRNNYDSIPGYARGSVLNGPGTGTSDSMLVRASTGEAITQAQAVRYYGPKFFEDLNKMKLPRYANGGFPMGSPRSTAYGQQSDGPQVNVNVVQNYPTTRDPIKTLKQDAESVVAGIWN